MFTCKQVSKTLAKEDYQKLPFFKKLGLRVHVALCLVCGRFNKQVMLMQDTCLGFKEHEDEILEKLPGMEESQKEQLKAVLVKSDFN